jgi:tRNA-modifying protein YgfZ
MIEFMDIVQKSPLTDYYVNLGYNGGDEGIKYFSTPEEEISALYDGVGLIDHSSKGILELRGNDVLDFLHRITTNSLKDMAKEEFRSTIFTTEKGRIIDTASIFNFETHQLLICSSVHKQKVMRWIDKYTISDDVKLLNGNNSYVILELLGPQAESFAMMLCGKAVNEIKNNFFKVISAEGAMFFIGRKETENRAGFWIIADIENGKTLVNFLIHNMGAFDFRLIGSEAYNSYRIEQGIPSAPEEINDNYNPHELGLMHVVDSKKGCYIGQEVIARLETYDKVKKLLTGLVFPEAPKSNLTIIDESNLPSGEVTSAAYSLKCKKHIGLAFIKKALVKQNETVTVKDEEGNLITAEIKIPPFKK